MRHRESDPEIDRAAAPVGDGPDEVLLRVARRLERAIERQAALVERLHDARSHADELVCLADLRRNAQDLRRGGDTLLLLGGAAPAGPEAAPLPVLALLRDTAAADTDRVGVGPGVSATVRGQAVPDVGRALAELLEYVLDQAYSGSRIELTARWTDHGGVVLEVAGDLPDSATDLDVPGLALVGRLGRRLGIGLTVRSGRPGEHAAFGLHVASHLVAAAETAPPERSHAATPWRPTAEPARGAGGSGARADELFGPLAPGTPMVDLADTPIYEAIASAWFRDTAGTAGAGDDWDAPGDAEWAAATARAARVEQAPDTTTAGLPRRRPGTQMVTPPLQQQNAVAASGPGERAPERVRSRLAVYQQGLRRGRHRAGEPPDELDDASDPWWRGLDA